MDVKSNKALTPTFTIQFCGGSGWIKYFNAAENGLKGAYPNCTVVGKKDEGVSGEFIVTTEDGKCHWNKKTESREHVTFWTVPSFVKSVVASVEDGLANVNGG